MLHMKMGAMQRGMQKNNSAGWWVTGGLWQIYAREEMMMIVWDQLVKVMSSRQGLPG